MVELSDTYTLAMLFSLCASSAPSSFACIFPGKLPGSLLLARRFVRARMNSDLSRWWERACSSRDLFRGRMVTWRGNGKKREGGCFNSKINTYSRDFITNEHIRSMHGRDSAGITRVIWTKRRRRVMREGILRVIQQKYLAEVWPEARSVQ